jgi:hypothetical protein
VSLLAAHPLLAQLLHTPCLLSGRTPLACSVAAHPLLAQWLLMHSLQLTLLWERLHTLGQCWWRALYFIDLFAPTLSVYLARIRRAASHWSDPQQGHPQQTHSHREAAPQFTSWDPPAPSAYVNDSVCERDCETLISEYYPTEGLYENGDVYAMATGTVQPTITTNHVAQTDYALATNLDTHGDQV